MPLTITAFKDEKFTIPVSAYIFMLNPEDFKDKYSISYSKKDPIGGVEGAYRFDKISPREVSFSTVIDATGIVSKIRRSLNAEILLLKKTVYKYSGSTHSPPYLTLVWGTALFFKCRLKSMDIEYNYFSSFGIPLRAKVTMSFVHYQGGASAKDSDTSPDMTHEVVVKPGDSLPALCQDVYGDELRYMQVAEYNKLDNFRDLKPGSQLAFPPIK